MTTNLSPRCVACDGTHVERLGLIPVFTPDLLGKPRNGQNTLGTMFTCHDCGLRFRWPMPTRDELDRYYQNQSSGARWQYCGERPVWKAIKLMLKGSPGSSVLDIGCFRGDLLNYIGTSWKRYGVEPSPEARQEAKSKGIEIVGSAVEDFDTAGLRLGAITLVDVIEHLPRPFDCLRKLTNLLLPGGKLLIFTGSTDAWSWRFGGLRYWYSAMPEHLVFFCPHWFRWAASRLDCVVSRVEWMPHRSASWLARTDEGLKNVIYTTYHGLTGVPILGPAIQRLPGIRRVGRWDGCWWTTARDHILITLIKKD